jgi:HKD family nuclease
LLRLQSSEGPAEIRNAIVDILDPNTSDVRIASAYVTLGGTKMLFDCLSAFLTQAAINKIPKTLITCFDYGITEPKALEHWRSMPNTTVRVAGAKLLTGGSLLPTYAFHPKVYAFGLESAHANILVGSANLTSRGFSVNTEAAWIEKNVAVGEVDALFLSSNSRDRTTHTEASESVCGASRK